MKVLHIVGGDLKRGAHRGAYWLHEGLLNIGAESVVLGPIPRHQRTEALLSTANGAPGRLLDMAISHSQAPFVNSYRGSSQLPFSTGFMGRDVSQHPALQSADIVNIHWIAQGPISIRSIARLGKPVVWTIRDMWPFTGGCHYALDCSQYRNQCGACPQLGSSRQWDLSRLGWKLKNRYYRDDVTLVGISQWISRCAQESSLFRDHDIRTIPNCVDSDVFFPVDRDAAREVLHIPPGKRVVLAGAESFANWYKGFDLLTAALNELRDADFLLVLFGSESQRLEGMAREVRQLGYLSDDIALRAAYSAADVFVAPSRQEAFGKTLAEALCCGTPVVAFAATGPQDIVGHLQTGYLAEPFDANDLAAGIRWALTLDDEETTRRVCSKDAGMRFGKDQVARQYLALYEELVINSGTRGV
jgi:glycosyltransferase involved in cell wall biosynthesis